MVGVARMTLLTWLRAGKVPEPRRVQTPGGEARAWSQRDVERVRQYKAAHYCKGRGRKPATRRNKP